MLMDTKAVTRDADADLKSPSSLWYSMSYRYYDPSIGRFITEDPDPLTEQDRQNLYAYVGNDPINKTDPTGTEAFANNHSAGSDFLNDINFGALASAPAPAPWTAPAVWGSPIGAGDVKLRMYGGTNPDGTIRLSYHWEHAVGSDYSEGLSQYHITLPAGTPQDTINGLRSMASGMAND